MPMADWVGSCLIHETGNDWKDAPLMPKGEGWAILGLTDASLYSF